MATGSFHDEEMIDNHRQALKAIKEFLEWGAKTGSDRELFDDKFRFVLRGAGVEFKEPEY